MASTDYEKENCLAYLTPGCMNFNKLTPTFSTAIKDVFKNNCFGAVIRQDNYNRQYGSAARVSNRYSCPADVTEKNIYEAVIYYSNTVVQTQNCAHKADKEAVNNSSSCKKISAGLEDRLKRTSKKFAGVVRTGVTIAPLTCSTTFGL